jgi:hypothetical protein
MVVQTGQPEPKLMHRERRQNFQLNGQICVAHRGALEGRTTINARTTGESFVPVASREWEYIIYA